jgi:predicted RNA binding protein YcfA (HicA-like mRNA interferase family)
MGTNYRPVKTKCWENLLTHLGYSCNRTKGSHDQWVKKGCRTIPVWGNEKQIPAMHLKASASTFQPKWELEDVHNWVDKNC